jgi:hypothetical protein
VLKVLFKPGAVALLLLLPGATRYALKHNQIILEVTLGTVFKEGILISDSFAAMLLKDACTDDGVAALCM